MKVTPIQAALPGERVVSVQPRLAVQVDGKWRRRLNLYTGRTLSDVALHAEQGGRAGRLVTMGQSISPGVVTGLELDLERDADGVPTFLHVAPGLGVAPSGEDVIVPHALRIRVADLLRDVATGLPLPVRTPADVRVLVLEPAAVRRDARQGSSDPCDVDESDDAFADEQTVDACYLRVVPWTDDWGALPAVDPSFRNRLAYQIFARELALGEGDLAPWERLGVPIGVFATLDRGDGARAVFVDRHAVVRAGGRAKRRTPLVSGAPFDAGSPFLWQARLQQFAEELADAAWSSLDLAEFPFLPPAGLLPLAALALPVQGGERRLAHHFLPGAWRVAALPLPLEQLDQVVNRAAALAPYDTSLADDVLVLVPVPQAVYEPGLLQIEAVSPIFAQTIAAARAARDAARSLRFAVRRDQRALARATLGPALTPRYPEFNPEYPADQQVPPDEGALADEAAVPLGENPEAEGGRFGVEGTGTRVEELTVTRWKALQQEVSARGVFSAEELADFATLGLAPFIKAIEEKLAKADDTIDFSFLKSHPNIYRVRQLMLGSTASSRLATSPVLATIAKGASASAVTAEVNKFFLNVKGHKPPGTTPPVAPKAAGAAPAAAPAPAPSPRLTRVSPAAFSRVMFFDAPTAAVRAATLAPSSSEGAGSTAFPALGADGFKTKLKTAFGRSSIVLLPAASTRDTVQGAPPIAGEGAYDFRTASIAERIEDSPSREAKSYAVAAKAEALEAIKLLHDEHMNLADIPVFGVPELAVDLTPVFERRFIAANGGDTSDDTHVLNPRFGMVKRVPSIQFGELMKLPGGLGRVLRDPPGNDADEGNLFSETVTVIEHAVATLRAVEGRIAEYRAEVARCKVALAELEELRAAAERRLAALGDVILEERHKVATATALLEDETARVAQINERRQLVLDQHVRFYAYARPRFAEALVDAPAVNLDPGVFATPVPGCLAEHADAPVELEQMVQLLREAPVAWFVQVPKLLDKLDRVELLHGTLQIAKLRAVALRDADAAPSTFVARAPLGKLGVAIDKVTRAQQSVVTNLRYQVARLDLARFAGMGWRETREEATRVLSLGDLIESNHGRSLVAEQAARELTQIGRIAACLYAQASDVVPAIRLAWAERLSQYEESVTLRDLTALPRWGEVPYIDRKELQTLADWLYARVDGRQAEGLAWMHDLVRVCLLLASHAPVDDIIAGSVPVETPASPGRTVPVTIDPARVRLGMKVMFFQAQTMVAHGVVEDLVGGQARTRIAETVGKDVLLAAGTRAHFVDAAARTAPSFFRKVF